MVGIHRSETDTQRHRRVEVYDTSPGAFTRVKETLTDTVGFRCNPGSYAVVTETLEF